MQFNSIVTNQMLPEFLPFFAWNLGEILHRFKVIVLYFISSGGFGIHPVLSKCQDSQKPGAKVIQMKLETLNGPIKNPQDLKNNVCIWWVPIWNDLHLSNKDVLFSVLCSTNKIEVSVRNSLQRCLKANDAPEKGTIQVGWIRLYWKSIAKNVI